MDVSVIIINYNTYELTCSCIQSIIREAGNGYTYEIILVDNASTETDAENFLKQFPSIKLIKSTVNAGFARGNNLGIRQAEGEYILLLNSDTVLKNDAIGICLSFLRADASVAVVSGRLEYPDGHVQHNCQRFPSIGAKLFELFRLQKIFSRSVGSRMLFGSFFDHNTVTYPDWVWGTFFMFPRKLKNGYRNISWRIHFLCTARILNGVWSSVILATVSASIRPAGFTLWRKKRRREISFNGCKRQAFNGNVLLPRGALFVSGYWIGYWE